MKDINCYGDESAFNVRFDLDGGRVFLKTAKAKSDTNSSNRRFQWRDNNGGSVDFTIYMDRLPAFVKQFKDVLEGKIVNTEPEKYTDRRTNTEKVLVFGKSEQGVLKIAISNGGNVVKYAFNDTEEVTRIFTQLSVFSNPRDNFLASLIVDTVIYKLNYKNNNGKGNYNNNSNNSNNSNNNGGNNSVDVNNMLGSMGAQSSNGNNNVSNAANDVVNDLL